MKFYTSGNKENPTILLIPGTCCHWTIFQEVIPLLEKQFYTITVSFDGFDETEDTIYPTMAEEAEKIERYVREQFHGRIDCCYGCSLGGSYAAYLVQRKEIHIDHVIIGSSDMDSAGKIAAAMKARLITPTLYSIISLGKTPIWLEIEVRKRKKEDAEMGRQLERCVNLFTHSPLVGKLKKQSIYNQYYSDLVTPIAHGIDVEGTMIHVFYATKMGRKYEQRYLMYFKHPDIRRQNMRHETFFFCYPLQWVKEVENCCGIME